MVWYVSTWYDVSIIGYCRVWYGVLEWYDVSMLWYVMLWFVILVGRVS